MALFNSNKRMTARDGALPVEEYPESFNMGDFAVAQSLDMSAVPDDGSIEPFQRQPISKPEIAEAYQTLLKYREGKASLERRLIEKLFKTHLREQGLTPVVFHSLRHFSTSIKLSLCGDIKAVQGDTGHATADMVTGVYGHAFICKRQKLAVDLEESFFHPAEVPAVGAEKLEKIREKAEL